MKYTPKNTTLEYHNEVELWLLDDQEVLIAFYNLKCGTVSIYQSEIHPLRAANLILFHMWSKLSLEQQSVPEDYRKLEEILELTILTYGEDNE